MTTELTIAPVDRYFGGVWYRVVRADNGEPIGGADVEGSPAEMAALALALDNGLRALFRQCAVESTKLRVELWSPAGNRGGSTIITPLRAKQLAANIMVVLDNA